MMAVNHKEVTLQSLSDMPKAFYGCRCDVGWMMLGHGSTCD
jgi:hypothetical protein